MARSRVVLPQPLSPMSDTTSPCATSKLTFRRTGKVPALPPATLRSRNVLQTFRTLNFVASIAMDMPCPNYANLFKSPRITLLYGAANRGGITFKAPSISSPGAALPVCANRVGPRLPVPAMRRLLACTAAPFFGCRVRHSAFACIRRVLPRGQDPRRKVFESADNSIARSL